MTVFFVPLLFALIRLRDNKPWSQEGIFAFPFSRTVHAYASSLFFCFRRFFFVSPPQLVGLVTLTLSGLLDIIAMSCHGQRYLSFPFPLPPRSFAFTFILDLVIFFAVRLSAWTLNPKRRSGQTVGGHRHLRLPFSPFARACVQLYRSMYELIPSIVNGYYCCCCFCSPVFGIISSRSRALTLFPFISPLVLC